MDRSDFFFEGANPQLASRHYLLLNAQPKTQQQYHQPQLHQQLQSWRFGSGRVRSGRFGSVWFVCFVSSVSGFVALGSSIGFFLSIVLSIFTTLLYLPIVPTYYSLYHIASYLRYLGLK